MDPQLFEMFNQRMDAQGSLLQEIRSTTKDTNAKLIEHQTSIWWLKRLQWALWAAIAGLFGIKH